MATSESDIKKAVSILLKKYGSLSTSEVKKLLETVMPFDADDTEQRASRPGESKIIQRIGNIISHQQTQIKIYDNSYQIDKNNGNAIWSTLKGLESDGTLRPISNTETKSRKKIARNFSPKIIDWKNLAEERSETGNAGERFALRYETNRILEFAPNDLDRIVHLSVEQGDGAGYDILSINQDGSDRYIEVKTTKLGKDAPFYLSANEKEFFKMHKSEKNAYIYRVYNFSENPSSGSLEIIGAEDLFSKYDFDPISFKVTRKSV